MRNSLFLIIDNKWYFFMMCKNYITSHYFCHEKVSLDWTVTFSFSFSSMFSLFLLPVCFSASPFMSCLIPRLSFCINAISFLFPFSGIIWYWFVAKLLTVFSPLEGCLLFCFCLIKVNLCIKIHLSCPYLDRRCKRFSQS